MSEQGVTLTNRILQLIEVALKKINATLTGGSSSGFTGVITAVEAGNQIIGSGINLNDLGGPGTEPFDSALKLRIIEDEESTGITYVGYSEPNLATSNASWFVQRITSVVVSTKTTHTQEYAIGSWDNRATLTYY